MRTLVYWILIHARWRSFRAKRDIQTHKHRRKRAAWNNKTTTIGVTCRWEKYTFRRRKIVSLPYNTQTLKWAMSQWRRLLRARGPCVKQQTIHWLNCGGQHEKAKSGGARQKFFNGTSSRTCALCPSPTVTFVMAPLNIAEADNGQR